MKVLYLSRIYIEALGIHDVNIANYKDTEHFLASLSMDDKLMVNINTASFIRLTGMKAASGYQKVYTYVNIADVETSVFVSELDYGTTDFKDNVTKLCVRSLGDGTLVLYKNNECNHSDTTQDFNTRMSAAYGKVVGVDAMLRNQLWTNSIV